jgi:hypothetical protein
VSLLVPVLTSCWSTLLMHAKKVPMRVYMAELLRTVLGPSFDS